MQDVMAIIAKCNDNLSRWNKQTFGNVCKNLAEAKQWMQNVQSMDQHMASNVELKEVQKEVHVWL